MSIVVQGQFVFILFSLKQIRGIKWPPKFNVKEINRTNHLFFLP
jgi:hypothetical protein